MALLSSISINIDEVDEVEHYVLPSSTPEAPAGLVTVCQRSPGLTTVHLHGTPEELAELAVSIYLAASDLATACRSSEVAA